MPTLPFEHRKRALRATLMSRILALLKNASSTNFVRNGPRERTRTARSGRAKRAPFSPSCEIRQAFGIRRQKRLSAPYPYLTPRGPENIFYVSHCNFGTPRRGRLKNDVIQVPKQPNRYKFLCVTMYPGYPLTGGGSLKAGPLWVSRKRGLTPNKACLLEAVELE